MTCTQAVLLAAGRGSRLAPLTDDRPKCMVEVAGRAIVDDLVDGIAATGVRELVVVTGYRADALRAHLGRARRGIRIRYVDNPAWATTNNICSLDLARPHVRAPFMLLESDVHVEPSVVAAVAVPDRMAVAAYTPVMTGTGVRVGVDGRVREMILGAHRGDTRGVAKTVNFTSFSPAVWAAYERRVAVWIAAGRTGEYYEAVLAELVNAGQVAMMAADVTDHRWWEIDDVNDLRVAEAMVAAETHSAA
jgi:NDP-sugar pyrophosphorylase family protein